MQFLHRDHNSFLFRSLQKTYKEWAIKVVDTVTAGGASITIPIMGVQENDVAILYDTVYNPSSGVVTPPGWTLQDSTSGPSNTLQTTHFKILEFNDIGASITGMAGGVAYKALIIIRHAVDAGHPRRRVREVAIWRGFAQEDAANIISTELISQAVPYIAIGSLRVDEVNGAEFAKFGPDDIGADIDPSSVLLQNNYQQTRYRVYSASGEYRRKRFIMETAKGNGFGALHGHIISLRP